PEKYIRTFAGDMDMVKKGGTPDLTPLDAPAPTKPVAVPLPPVHTLVPPPAVPLPPPAVPPPAAVPEAPKNPPLQTYSNDFRDRIKATHASTATVLAAEQDKTRRAPSVVISEPSRMNLSYVIAGLVLLIASVAGGYIAYTRYTTVSLPVVPAVSARIFVDEREEIAGTGSALVQTIISSVGRPLAAGTVRLLYVASTTGTENVFSALPVSAPDVLLRNMNVDGSMTGVISMGNNQSPFFILSVSSYSNVFSSMLAWEPLMPGYLAELFPPFLALIPETATTTSKSVPEVASTTSTVAAFVAGFYDATIANHDVRVYRDASGRDVLLYGFWDQTTLVIARDAVAFTEIVGRLGTTRAQ
ncbi:MAG: hypothetical protein AAB882_01945, partial [Patescibacteria group bacterium]